jgi:protein-disulfide isomerase
VLGGYPLSGAPRAAPASQETAVLKTLSHRRNAPLSRRAALAGAATLALALSLAAPSIAQQKKGAAEVSVEELMKPGPLPDMVLGKADAPVTIVEYASMTCGHCAKFHNTIYPELKTKYIDTGKAKLILREFPLDNLAAAASMLARCAGPEKSYELVGKLFKEQETWAFAKGNPVPALFKTVEGLGFTKESFDKCLTDQKVLDGVTATRDRANKAFGVTSTPTFFINGKRLDNSTLDGFQKAIDPLLAAAPAAAAPAAAPPAKK